MAEPALPCRYDLVVDLGEELVKTQVKRGFEDNREKTLRVNMMGSVHDGGTEYESVTYAFEDVDPFAIHAPITDRVYWLRYEGGPIHGAKKKV